MSDAPTAEQMLSRLTEIIANQVMQRPEDIDDPAAVLDEILDHKAACGLIDLRGRHWFSDEDLKRLREAAYINPRTLLGSPNPSQGLAHRILTAIQHCYTAEDFTHLMAQLVLQATAQIGELQSRILAAANLLPTHAFLIGDPTPKEPT